MTALQIKNTALAVLAGIGSFVANALGGWDMALQVLIGFMVVDYVTGFLVAAVWHNSSKSQSGALCSDAGFKGLIKKCVILMMVWIAAMLDRFVGTDFVRTAVCMFYIANEGLSILENTCKMGVPWPSFVKNMLDAMKEQGDAGKPGKQT